MLTTSYGASLPSQLSYGPVQRGFVSAEAPGSRAYYSTPALEPLKPQGNRTIRLPLTEKFVVLFGLIVLTLLIAPPVSDSAILLADFNYKFWSGDALPIGVIVALVCTMLLYLAVSSVQAEEQWTVRSLATIASTFCILLGIIMVLSSLFLNHSVERVANDLIHNCAGSLVTHDVRQSYSALLAIRKTPECAKIWSVADCKGYGDAAPTSHAAYLKGLEDQFRCSGFCAASTAAATVAASSAANATKAGNGSFAQVDTFGFLGKSVGHAGHADVQNAERMHRAVALPPALFSQSKYKTSCDGAASRNLTYMGLGISKAWWWMSIVLIGLSAVISVGEIVTSPKY